MQATAMIAQHTRMLLDHTKTDSDSDGDMVLSGDGGTILTRNCSQAVILLDQMGLCKSTPLNITVPALDALTEVVTDEHTFSDLLFLFICP